LIEKGSPIVIVEDEEFRKLIEEGRPARCSDTIHGVPIAYLRRPEEAEFKRIARIEGPLDREFAGKGRVEQAYLRSRLFQGAPIRSCDLCGMELPIELLVAAHIKPRSECMDKERRDAEDIVFALCQLGCDALYEQGFASVDDQGKVVTVATKGLPSKLSEIIRQIKGRGCPSWRPETEGYFHWHLYRRFRGLEWRYATEP
jgi:hypothetical protein